MGVDEDRAGAAVGCDTVGWEGVVGDEVEYFAGARIEKAVARRAHTFGSGERGWCGIKSRERQWEGDIFQLDGHEVCLELGGGVRQICIIVEGRYDCLRMKKST